MSTVNVTIRMDENLKKQADELFADLGISLNSAITMFTKQAIREQRIPFEISRNTLSMASDTDVDSLSKRFIAQNKKAYEELAK